MQIVRQSRSLKLQIPHKCRAKSWPLDNVFNPVAIINIIKWLEWIGILSVSISSTAFAWADRVSEWVAAYHTPYPRTPNEGNFLCRLLSDDPISFQLRRRSSGGFRPFLWPFISFASLWSLFLSRKSTNHPKERAEKINILAHLNSTGIN